MSCSIGSLKVSRKSLSDRFFNYDKSPAICQIQQAFQPSNYNGSCTCVYTKINFHLFTW